jgi:hypothetical protein
VKVRIELSLEKDFCFCKAAELVVAAKIAMWWQAGAGAACGCHGVRK